MQVRSLGPLGMVAGSWLQDLAKGWSLLIDFGMQHTEWGSEARNKQSRLFRPAGPHFVPLTHTHLDHCGLLARLYLDGFSGALHFTREARGLITFSLKNAARHLKYLPHPDA